MNLLCKISVFLLKGSCRSGLSHPTLRAPELYILLPDSPLGLNLLVPSSLNPTG